MGLVQGALKTSEINFASLPFLEEGLERRAGERRQETAARHCSQVTI